MIEGSRTTTIDDCHVSSRLFADSNLDSDASFGGLVGSVTPNCTASPVIKNSSFTDGFSGWTNRSSGLVGYTNLAITFKHCMVDPKETPYYDDCATFTRMASGVTCTFKECYYTQLMGGEQGEAVFRGCKNLSNIVLPLTISGPLGNVDLAVIRYLAGCDAYSAGGKPTDGCLRYLNLYDADIKKSDDLSAPDMFKVITHMGPSNVQADNELPTYAFLQAYNLKSLVLPKTCTKIETRALQQCEALETLVLGDNLVDFDWSALDDDAMLTRLYIMATKKPAMTQDCWLIRQLYNNYNPTFDAFYVRPSLLQEYLSDRTYTVDLQRTNLISTGDFDEDDSFCAFAAHAAATKDDLAMVTSVDGWFDKHPSIKDLTLLGYTAVDSLNKATTTAAVPEASASGSTTTSAATTLRTKTYRMTDSLSYIVPYAFEAEKIENARTLAASAIPYTVCVPYKLNVPAYARAYKLADRDGSTLVFTEVKGELEAMHPYLLKVVGNKRFRKMSTTLNTDIAQTIPASGGSTYGRQDDAIGYSLRGTFDAISNKEAAELGAYILQSDGDWHPVSTANDKASIRPFRAFLLLSARNAGARIGMSLVDDDATAIDSIETIDQDGTRRYYDLNGRELQCKPDKGLYIHNGKTYINK